jgi:hypothetical protein
MHVADTTVVLCVPVALKGAVTVAGAVQQPCDRCAAAIWVAPSTLAMSVKGPTIMVCPDCLTDAEREQMIMHVPQITPEQGAEIREYLRRHG